MFSLALAVALALAIGWEPGLRGIRDNGRNKDVNPICGNPPQLIGTFDFDLSEVMYYLYLPVRMRDASPDVLLPPNVECCRPMIDAALRYSDYDYRYAYLSARKGWATPDNPLNRPGWHCDGFGTHDLNFVWWVGPGTRFAEQKFHDISPDHVVSLQQFEAQIRPENVRSYPEKQFYALNPSVVHATPLIESPGCMRQYVKVSLSDHCYNLENNSHNYLFSYRWPLASRAVARNDTHTAQQDYAT